VGGGTVAERKIRKLIEAGGAVTVISPVVMVNELRLKLNHHTGCGGLIVDGSGNYLKN
jgi:siroheme synthase (precorrin-2 oxidase/ferrochelatase)